jgi:hypothetical protein
VTTDPAEAEATGQPFIVAVFRWHEYKLPTDADDWPLPLIAASVGVTREEKIVANHTMIARALSTLLGDQYDDFTRHAPRRRDLVPASRTFAAAAGFDGDLAFGSLPRLLSTITQYPAAVEATLTQLGVDYRDRFRFDTDQRRRLTLRQINNHLTYARRDSALAIAQNDGHLPLTATDVLLMDLYEAITKVAHPSRPLTAEQKATRAAVKSKTAQAAIDYRIRHPTTAGRKQAAVEAARANAPSKGRELK